MIAIKRSFAEKVSQSLKARERQLLLWLARFMTSHPWPVLLGCVVLAAVATLYTVQRMEFVTGRNDLISADKRYVQLDDEYAKEFMGIDQVVVVVEPRDVQEGKNFVA